MLVRTILEKYPDRDFHLMTPGGYVDLSSEQVKAVLNGEGVKAHPGVPEYDMEMGAEELLNEKVHSIRYEGGVCYLITDYAAGQEEPQGLRESEENMENSRKLRERLEANYEAYIGRLQGKPAAEIIEMAPEIAAAKFIYGEMTAEGAFAEYAGYLLRFENPLELLRDNWQSNENCDRHEEIDHVLWNMKDREIGIGDYPLAGQAEESIRNQEVVMC